MDNECTKVFFDIQKKKHNRVLVLEGSARSSKTWSICQYLIGEICISNSLKIPLSVTVCRERLTWLKSSVLKDFLTVLDSLKLYRSYFFNKTECIYHLGISEITFIGLDEPQKLHGRKQDIFWLNEAIETQFKDFEQLIIRTTRQGILDYNPSSETHWIYDKVLKRDDVAFLHSTYKDNDFLEPAIIQEIERLEPTPENIKAGTADEVSWKIYGLGVRASPKGLIYPEITIVKALPPEEDCKKIFYGLDFGFTNDPTAIVKVALAHGELWIKELVYERGLVNTHNPLKPQQKSIEQRLREIRPKHKIWADSAEPKSIQEIKDRGFSIYGADKGKDSVVNGIDLIKRYKLNVTEDSLNLIKEFRNYKWDTDYNTGEPLNKPIDNWNNGLDSLRYCCLMELQRPFASLTQMRSLGGSVYD